MSRPRDEAATAGILDAAIALIGEVGYERASLEAIARRAGASKATLYRRWPDKPTLVREALDRYDAGRTPEPPDTGSLRGDLLALVGSLAALATPEHVALMLGLATAMRCDPALGAALQAHVEDPEQQPVLPLLQRAVTRGELEAANPVLDEVLEALLIRRIQLGQPLDAAFAEHVVDAVLLPLTRRTP
jgi:AcrR family transcriptional regulator